MLIGLSGKRGSGKNTVAEIIQAHQTGWRIKAFADKLKLIASILTNVRLEEMYSQEGKKLFLPEWDMTVGEILQKIGTDAIRNGLHSEAWILATLTDYSPTLDKLIICDMRFPNEAEAIKARGGILIRMEGDPLQQQGDGTRDDTHPSETALDTYTGFDKIIFNIGSRQELEVVVKDIIRELTL
jgi:hypothetical protein